VRIVIALGGNALLQRGDKPDAAVQLVHVRAAAQALAPIAAGHELLICHGNGPQVGMLALESASDATLSHPYPLDDLVAQTQGMIGYWLVQSLRNAGVSKPILSLITQTQVDSTDPAFSAPSKFVGPGYSHEQAQKQAGQYGWTIAADGDRWRRVVVSPEPQRVIEQDSITALLDAGSVVICGGGGGAPVVEDSAGELTGVEAVVDKDYLAALLAIAVNADRLLVLTDVAAVMTDFGTPTAAPLTNVSLPELANMSFPAGSMAPKIEGCRRFVAATGKPATIGSLTDAAALLAGTAGTTITTTPAQQPHRSNTIAATPSQQHHRSNTIAATPSQQPHRSNPIAATPSQQSHMSTARTTV
jgi:carbamate kinase